jgi:hypothetical protein
MLFSSFNSQLSPSKSLGACHLFSKTTSFIHISIVSLFPLITFSFAEDRSIGRFNKIMSKDNAKNNYSSTNYAKIIIKFLIKRNEKMKVKKKHLQANGFKGFKKTFVNNGVYGLEKLSRNHSIFSFVSSWKNSS